VTDYDAAATPRRIIQTPGVIAILFESYNHYRQIFLDGRPLPKSPKNALRQCRWGSLVHDRLLSALAHGQGELDWSSVAKVAARNAGV
jgi:hypothetical protein